MWLHVLVDPKNEYEKFIANAAETCEKDYYSSLVKNTLITYRQKIHLEVNLIDSFRIAITFTIMWTPKLLCVDTRTVVFPD